MVGAFLAVAGIVLLGAFGVQIYFREKYPGHLAWHRNNMQVSYWKMICELREHDRSAGNWVMTAVVLQIVAGCVLLTAITLY